MSAREECWKFHYEADKRKANGEEIILLGMGVPDTRSSPELRQALLTAIEMHEGYIDSWLGNPELTAALAKQIGVPSPENIIITCGAQTGIYLAACLAVKRYWQKRQKDNCQGRTPPIFIAPSPYYPTYKNTIE